MHKISTKPNQVIMLLAVPIRCPNPQPRMVKNRSQQIFFLEIPNSLTCTHLFFKGAGATAEKEMGIAKSFGKKDMMLFSSLCKGLKSDVGIEKKLTIALWKNIDSIEGAVYPLTYGLSTPAPLPSVAAASGIVVAKKSGWTVLTPWLVEKIGTEFSVSLGAGVSPVDISFSQCTSKVHKRYKGKLS